MLFSTLLRQIPWRVFDQAVASAGSDKGHRRLNARAHLATLLLAQLLPVRGLRDIEAVTAAHGPALGRRGIGPVRRATFADANARRASTPVEALIPALLAKLSPSGARRAREDLRLVDATLIRPGFRADWARFQNGRIAAKIHLVFDPAAGLPTFFEVTPANTNDISVAKADMPVETGATCVFDLGYDDFAFWADLDRHRCRLVTRLKKNTPVTIVAANAVAPNGKLVLDRIVRLPGRLAASRIDPFDKPGRSIGVRLDTGRMITLFTNDLASPAETIAELYRQRRQIELFFRWLKQHLRIRHFFGRSENAVRRQIAAAIVVYLLLELAHAAAGTSKATHVFTATLRATLFHRLRLAELVRRIDPPPRRPNLAAADLPAGLAP